MGLVRTSQVRSKTSRAGAGRAQFAELFFSRLTARFVRQISFALAGSLFAG